MDEERSWELIAAERRALADLLDGLTPEQWEAPSLCAGWRVRDVAAHVALTPQHPSIGGMIAALFGLIDFQAIPWNTRAKRIGVWHGLSNVAVILLFGASWLTRWPNPSNPGALPVMLSLAGALLMLMAGWLGGELVERLGVGVDDGANLNAPNSLSGRPASERRTSEEFQ